MRQALLALAGAATLSLAACGSLMPPKSPMSFFVTSANPGKGADLGGLAGADRHCQSLAAAASAGHRSWRAYLSTTAAAGQPAVNARDRIGKGPWHNAKGELIAGSVDALHGNGNNLNKQTALTEAGEVVPGRGDARNDHDMLTGSTADGRAAEQTCNNWTSGGAGSAIVGHHDRQGLDELPPSKSWNASHPTRGCNLAGLRSTGSGGLFYCFAVD